MSNAGFGERGRVADDPHISNWDVRHRLHDPRPPAEAVGDARRRASPRDPAPFGYCGRWEWFLSCVGSIFVSLILMSIAVSVVLGQHFEDLQAWFMANRNTPPSLDNLPPGMINMMVAAFGVYTLVQAGLAVQFGRRMSDAGQPFGRGVLIYVAAFGACLAGYFFPAGAVIQFLLPLGMLIWGCAMESERA